MNATMKLAVAQCPAVSGEVATNLARIERFAQRAARQNASVLVCPEMMLTGYNIAASAVFELAQASDGPAVRELAQIAKRLNINIVYGYPEREGDVIYNSASLIRADGASALNHRKSHLFGETERAIFTAGDGKLATTEIEGWQTSLLICYDIEFPETVRLAALRGVDLLLAPTALMVPYDAVPDVVVRARAFENQIYTAYANYCGVEGGLTYCGKSIIAAPDGSVLGQAERREALVVATLDCEKLQRSRNLNRYLEDRRPELYAGLSAEGDR